MSRRAASTSRRFADGGSIPFVGSLHPKSRPSPLVSVVLVVVGALLVVGYLYSSSGDSYGREERSCRLLARSVINERIQEAHQNKSAPIIMLFPEGTTTNGEYLLPFKTGAFLLKAPVLPVILRYPHQRFSPAWDSISGVRHVILLFYQFVNYLEVTRLPVYYPSQQGKDDPKLYANNVRKLMAYELLGLDICADTVVGSNLIFVFYTIFSTGEMLVGPSNELFMDEISTGLDSSTTYQIVNSLCHAVHILQETALISLLQPAPETYNLFDDIILLSDGLIVYQGPREYVLEFFESMGFKCSERKGVADFLQEYWFSWRLMLLVEYYLEC